MLCSTVIVMNSEGKDNALGYWDNIKITMPKAYTILQITKDKFLPFSVLSAQHCKFSQMLKHTGLCLGLMCGSNLM